MLKLARHPHIRALAALTEINGHSAYISPNAQHHRDVADGRKGGVNADSVKMVGLKSGEVVVTGGVRSSLTGCRCACQGDRADRHRRPKGD